jgi:predicted alpha/beta-fold hydrolase
MLAETLNQPCDSSGVASQLRSGVEQIFSTGNAFAALKSDGSVVTWGNPDGSGDSSGVASQLRSGVEQIFSTGSAFAALKSDGSVVTWGGGIFNIGGNSSAVASQLSSGITHIFATRAAFSALKNNGSVITWGGDIEGDFGADSSAVASQLASDVVSIFSTSSAFAALKQDGSVVTWGEAFLRSSGGDSSGVASQLRSGVEQIFSNWEAFAALKSDGSVVTWGNSSSGGDSSGVASQLRSGVEQIFSNWGAFAALKSDGSVVTWGNSSSGGDSSGVASQLRSGVVAFANPFTDDRLVFDSTPPPSSLPTTYSIHRLSISDGEEGSRLWFQVKRSGATDQPGSVKVFTSGGTARLGTDYEYLSRTFQFAAGETSKDVYVDTYLDLLPESTETVRVSISNPEPGSSISGTSSVVGQIRNKNFNYIGVDGKGQQFQIKDYVTSAGRVQEFRRSDPSWSVTFHGPDRPLNLRRPTYVYIHGWKDNHQSSSSRTMMNALSTSGDNVILVDWRRIAALKEVFRPDKRESKFQPDKSVTATKQVGEAVADFLIKAGFSADSTTLIGHSLGSFVAAAAANEFKRRTGKRVKELVALDNAYGENYDIDGRND